MDNLAPELLEQIFAHIPLVDLLTVHSLVCRKWRDIIRRKNFLPWKKAYFQYKIQSHLGKSEILDSIVERDKEIKLEAEKVSGNPKERDTRLCLHFFQNNLVNPRIACK